MDIGRALKEQSKGPSSSLTVTNQRPMESPQAGIIHNSTISTFPVANCAHFVKKPDKTNTQAGMTIGRQAVWQERNV